jgi:hypothetical protein
VSPEVQRQLAAELFNFAWERIEQPDRQEADDHTMVAAAHASRLLWDSVGTPRQWATGEWQISRAYALVGWAEPARCHAERCLDLTKRHDLGPFSLGFAHEALARAYAVAGDAAQRDLHIQQARNSAAAVAEADDQKWLTANIDTVSSLTLPRWEPS